MSNKTVTNYSLWYVEATARAAREAFQLLCALPCTRQYLWFKPRGLAFKVAQDQPEGFELVTGEPVPADRTVEGITYWIRQYAGRVEVLPGD